MISLKNPLLRGLETGCAAAGKAFSSGRVYAIIWIIILFKEVAFS
jgi:hypothetical protein